MTSRTTLDRGAIKPKSGRSAALIVGFVVAILSVSFGQIAAAQEPDPATQPVNHGLKSYSTLIGNQEVLDAWTFGDVAFYVPDGVFTDQDIQRWVVWYDRVDELYEEVSQSTNFDLFYRQVDPHFGRKKVLGFVTTCGLGCGTASKAEADPSWEDDFLVDVTDYEPHWIYFYEMARTGAPNIEPFYGRATWPANTVLMPHLMAGIAFQEIGGDQALERGIPGLLLDALDRWEQSDLAWVDNFSEPNMQSAGGYSSHDLMAAMLYRILIDTDRATIVQILENMSFLPIATDATSAMCDFQKAVNEATSDAFAARLVNEWGMPADCPPVIVRTAPPTVFTQTLDTYADEALAFDSFVEAPGEAFDRAPGGSGWATGWEVVTGAGAASYEVASLSSTNVALPVAGNKLCIAPKPDESFQAMRRLETPVRSGDVWFSMLVHANQVGNGHLFVGFNELGGAQIGKAWGTNFSIENDKSSVTVAPNRTYQLVAKLELEPFGEDNIYFWIDPDLTTLPTPASAVATKTAEVGAVDRVSFNIQHWGGGDYCFDDLRFGNPLIEQGILADVTCDRSRTNDDALALVELMVGLRSANDGCPLPSPSAELNTRFLELYLDGVRDLSIVDALLIAQCVSGTRTDTAVCLNSRRGL